MIAEHESILNWHDVARQALVDAPEAYTWLSQVQNLAWCWDHIMDDDPLDKAVFNTSLEQVLLEWPMNPFYRANLAALVPAMASCISAWKRSDKSQAERLLAYAPAGDLASTVLFLVGGRQRVNEYAGLLRALAADICKRNDEMEQPQTQ